MLRRVSPALRIAIMYFVFSGCWILLSDNVVAKIAGSNAHLLIQIQSIKGILFITLCSFLLYFISNRLYQGIHFSLKKSEETLDKFKGLTEATKEGIIDLDLNTDKAEVNQKMQLILNANSTEISKFSEVNRSRLHPDDHQRVITNFNDTLATDSSIWQADYRYLFNDGKYHDVLTSGYILRNSSGVPERFIAAMQDVTVIRNIQSVFYEQQIKHKQMLGQSIIKAQEAERNRWAEELHDNVGQLLTVVKLYLDQLATESVKTPDIFDKTKSMVSKALDDIRQLSTTIKPPEFAITTLRQSIQQLISDIKRIKNYSFDFELKNFDESLLSDEQKLMIYRVVQEQLSNIIKYANASQISILISATDQKINIQVKDNGEGFDPDKIDGGLGLRNIRSRLQMFSGSMEITSSAGKGCVLLAEFIL